MDSKYSTIPKSTYVELQPQTDYPNDLNSPRSSSFNEAGYLRSKDVEGDDIEIDVDNYPLVVIRPNSGSGVDGAVFNLRRRSTLGLEQEQRSGED